MGESKPRDGSLHLALGAAVFGDESRVGQVAWAVVRRLTSVPLPREITGGLTDKGDIILSMPLKDQARSCIPPGSSP